MQRFVCFSPLDFVSLFCRRFCLRVLLLLYSFPSIWFRPFLVLFRTTACGYAAKSSRSLNKPLLFVGLTFCRCRVLLIFCMGLTSCMGFYSLSNEVILTLPSCLSDHCLRACSESHGEVHKQVITLCWTRYNRSIIALYFRNFCFCVIDLLSLFAFRNFVSASLTYVFVRL